jgi:hypothetical protein
MPGTPIAITVSTGPPPAPTLPPTNATPGAPDANTYETVEEFKTYCAARGHVPTLPADAVIAGLLIQGTSILDNTLVSPPDLTLAYLRGLKSAYAWTGLPASATQALAWPRLGQLTRNGLPMDPTLVPQGVKDSVSEIVIGLLTLDLTATDDVGKQEINTVKAGSVMVGFGKKSGLSIGGKAAATPHPAADERIRAQAMPDAAWLPLVPSWYVWNVQTQMTGGNPAFDFSVI